MVDKTKPYKVIDGVEVNLTSQEIMDFQAQQSSFANEIANAPTLIPDLATQLAKALIAKGTLVGADINSQTLTAANAILSSDKLQTIS